LGLPIDNGFDDGEEVEGRPSQAVDAADDHDVARINGAQQLVELTPIGARTAHLLAEPQMGTPGAAFLSYNGQRAERC